MKPCATETTWPMPKAETALRKLPSVDEVMRAPAAVDAIGRYGRAAMVDAVRATIAQARAGRAALSAVDAIAGALARLEAAAQPSLRPVFNLTGTVLHTNLGRALIAEEAIEAAVAAMRNAVALEFDLGSGRRGERDDHRARPAVRTDRRRGRDRRQQQCGGGAARAQHAGARAARRSCRAAS